MNENTITLCGETIENGQIKDIEMHLPNLYHTPISIPIKVFRGKKAGPTVFVSAAIHGDEINGIEIIRRLKKLSLLKKLKGTLILVPVVNIYGLNTLSRYLPDRRDLNRCFPGSETGSLAGRIAKQFFDEIIIKCDYGIDLHTAAVHRSNLPQVRTNIEDEVSFELAKAFEAPVILHSALRDGSLRAVALDRDIRILLYEAGEALRFDETSIKIGVKGVVNVLKSLGMLAQTKKRRAKNSVITNSSSWVRASDSGMLRSFRGLGDTVKKGDILANIDQPLGEDSSELLADFDGIIIGRTEIPLVQEGDAVFHIARFEDLDMADTRIEYFQENALDKSDIEGLHSELPIE